MGNSLYAVKQTGLCPACRYDLDSVMHYRLHVPRDRWPASMRKGAPRVEHGPYARASAAPDMAVSGEASAPASTVLADVAGAGTASSPEAATTLIIHSQAMDGWNLVDGSETHLRSCECGWSADKATQAQADAAYRLHRAKAKQHREVTNGA